jgi:hypothetical protein
VDFLAGFLLFVVVYFVAMWILSATARRRRYFFTSAPTETALAACADRFSRMMWKQVQGEGDLNYRYRWNLSVKGSRPPVISISADIDQDGDTQIQMWLASATSYMGVINQCERVALKQFAIKRAMGSLPAPTGPGTVPLVA